MRGVIRSGLMAGLISLGAWGGAQAFLQKGAEQWVAEHLSESDQKFIGALSRPDLSNSSMGNMSCCDKTDCHGTEQEIKDGKYRARIGKLVDNEWVLLDWVDIPDAKVIKKLPEAGKHPGYPILCETNSKASSNSSELLWVTLYCFVPGVLM